MAERFQTTPYGTWETMSAAQVAVVIAALQEDEVPITHGRKNQPLRQEQPKLNRDVLLAIARKTDPGVWDAQVN